MIAKAENDAMMKIKKYRYIWSVSPTSWARWYSTHKIKVSPRDVHLCSIYWAQLRSNKNCWANTKKKPLKLKTMPYRIFYKLNPRQTILLHTIISCNISHYVTKQKCSSLFDNSFMALNCSKRHILHNPGPGHKSKFCCLLPF